MNIGQQMTVWLVTGVAAWAAGAPAAAEPQAEGAPPNILIALADDVGVDMLASYGLGADLPNLPTIDMLASTGVQFDNVWANTLCGPTRATLMTGRYCFRTGIGGQVTTTSQPLLPGEITLPEMLDLGTSGLYAHSLYGKWHLAIDAVSGPSSPDNQGWGNFEGVADNIGPPHIANPPPYDYFFYPKITNGSQGEEVGYITTDMVDWFLEWESLQLQPWVAVLSFNAPHSPWHTPPAGLYTTDLTMAPPPDVDPRPYYKADLEALDFELGRALAGLGSTLANTIVIFLGDNGTPFPVPVPPFDPLKAKVTLYEGGVHVPMIVCGPQVVQPGSQCSALVNVTDVFATVAEWANVDLPSALPAGTVLDSISFAPYVIDPSLVSQRSTLYSELFTPNGTGPYSLWQQAMRNARYKLIRFTPGLDEFYDLQTDPFEDHNLLLSGLSQAEQDAFRELDGALIALAPIPMDPPLTGDARLAGPAPPGPVSPAPVR